MIPAFTIITGGGKCLCFHNFTLKIQQCHSCAPSSSEIRDWLTRPWWDQKEHTSSVHSPRQSIGDCLQGWVCRRVSPVGSGKERVTPSSLCLCGESRHHSSGGWMVTSVEAKQSDARRTCLQEEHRVCSLGTKA